MTKMDVMAERLTGQIHGGRSDDEDGRHGREINGTNTWR